MKTIYAADLLRCLGRLDKAQAHLASARVAMGLPGYAETLLAGYAIDDARDIILCAAVQDVAVELVRVMKIIPGAPVDVVPAFVMAAE